MPTASAQLERKGRDVVTISPDRSVLEAATMMNDGRIGCLVVVEHDEICGIVSERDILTRVVAQCRPPARTSVRSVMTREVLMGTGETTLDELRALMRERRIRHVPIIENGSLSGIISIGDLNSESREALCHTITTLESYIRQG